MTRPATAVLVHGAWHGAWCWEPLLALLEERGIPAVARDLPGHGKSAEPLGDLRADAASVRRALDETSGPIVLLGHSYGGMVITEAAASHRGVTHLVYLTAFLPAEGESLHDLVQSDPTPVALLPGIVNRGDGTLVVDPAVAPAAFYADCSPDDAARAVSRLGPQLGRSFLQAPRELAWKEKPATFVTCTKDEAIAVSLLRRMALRATERLEWEASHSPFLSRAELVADLLEELCHAYATESPS